MRRIFRDRTAIALTFGLGLPGLASAQVLSAADAARIGAERASNMPELAQMLEKERGEGLTADALGCLMNAPKPCTEGTPLFTPQGIAVQLTDDGGFILAPAPQQIKRVDGSGQLVPVKDGKNYGAPRADAATEAAVVTADAGAAAAAAAGEAAVIPPVKADEKAANKAAKEAEKAAAETKKAADKAAKEAEKAASAAEKAAKEDAANAAAGDAAVEAAAKGGAGAVVVAPPAADTSEPQKSDAAPKDAATESPATAASEADLARALAERESAAAAPAGSDPVVVPATPAVAPVVASGATEVAPAPAAAPAVSPAEQDALAEALAAAKAIPEASAKETDASREAAAGTAVPEVAALTESSAPVVTSEKTTVTEANSRAATEDFATDLSGQARAAVAAATAAAGGQPAPAFAPDTKDSGGNDLETALKQAILPALAGMAVGSMLPNNREVALNTGDRVIVTRTDGSQEIIKDDNALLFRPGSTVQTENYTDGSSRTVVARADGSQVITIRDADLRVLRRTVVHPDGTTTALIDETAAVQPVDVAALPKPAEPVIVMPGQTISDAALREALRRETDVGRIFTLGQIRNIPEVRALVAPVDIQAITFDTGSAAIKADQAQALSTLGRVIVEQIRQNPREMFLIEGHTDTVGANATNLALSDRRAESVALALTEFFQVPPENMVVQGYGEQFLKVAREGDVRANRRAAVRRITDLLARN